VVSQQTETKCEQGIPFGCRFRNCRIWTAATTAVSSRPPLHLTVAVGTPLNRTAIPGCHRRLNVARVPDATAGASVAVLTPASGGSGDVEDMNDRLPPPPPPAQPRPVDIAAMAGTTATAAAALEALAALPAPLPAPNSAGPRAPSDSEENEKGGGASAGEAAIIAAAALAQGKRAAPRTTPFQA